MRMVTNDQDLGKLFSSKTPHLNFVGCINHSGGQVRVHHAFDTHIRKKDDSFRGGWVVLRGFDRWSYKGLDTQIVCPYSCDTNGKAEHAKIGSLVGQEIVMVQNWRFLVLLIGQTLMKEDALTYGMLHQQQDKQLLNTWQTVSIGSTKHAM